MTKILLLYASHYGQTRAIAQAIAAELRVAQLDVTVVDTGETKPPPPQGFDAVVLGSRVELDRHAVAITEYVAHHREVLRTKPTAFFSVSMAAASPGAGSDPNGYLSATFDKVAWKPALSASFAGALPYRKYNWFVRLMMKRISRDHGRTVDTRRDHEFTDWQQVLDFAKRIVDLVRPLAERATQR